MVIQFFPQGQKIEEQKLERPIVYTHVFFKGIQIASTLSPIIYLGMAAFGRRTSYLRLLSRANMLLVPTTIGMGYYMLDVKHDAEKNKARAFRLQRNLHQYYLEDWTAIGLLSGLLVGIAAPRLGIVNTTLIGSSLGYYASSFILLGTRYGFVSGEVFDKTNLS